MMAKILLLTALLLTGGAFAVAQMSYSPADLSKIKQGVFDGLNYYRNNNKMGALAANAYLDSLALAHSQAMASGRVPFSHDGFEQRRLAAAKKIGLQHGAENVYSCNNYAATLIAKKALVAWKNSPGHRKNMEAKDFTLTGIGVAVSAKGEVFITQLFLGE